MANVASTLSKFYFSPDIPDLLLTTTARTVLQISTLADGGRGECVEVFQTTYYPEDGTVTFRDLRSIVEAYMLQHDLSVQLFRFKYGSEVQDTTIIFSRTKIFGYSAEEFVKGHFLTTQWARLTSATSKEYLYFYEPYPEDYVTDGSIRTLFSAQVLYRIQYLLDGEVCTAEKSSTDSVPYGMNTRTLDMSALGNIFQAKLPAEATPIMVSLSVNGKSFVFYISQKVGQNEFYFRNNFNCYELAVIPSSTTTKTETESSTAICCDQMIQYDIEHTQTFEVQSAQLLLSHAKWLTEMLTSPEIRLNNRIAKQIKKMPEILIVDYTSELTDAPGEENSVQFEWQYASRDMATFLEQSDYGIFTKEYTEQYE